MTFRNELIGQRCNFNGNIVGDFFFNINFVDYKFENGRFLNKTFVSFYVLSLLSHIVRNTLFFNLAGKAV